MLVVCCGIQRSGSTLQYQLACELAELAGGVRLGYGVGSAEPAMLESPRPIWVVKDHDFRKVVTRWGPYARFICSHRDPRDALASMIQRGKERNPGNWARYIVKNAERWTSLPGALVSRYDKLLSNLEGEATKIAAHMEINASPAQIAEITHRLSLESQRRFTDSLSSQKDERTQLKRRHIHDGEVGKWERVLTAEQALAVEEAVGDWMRREGYLQNEL